MKAYFVFPVSQAGFSLLGALAGAAIGLVVVMGTTQSFIQQKISLLALEKRIARRGVNDRHKDGWQMFMGKDWSCKNTLRGKKLSGSSGDAKRAFKITAIKDSAAAPATVWDFSKNSAGELTNSATKQKLKSLGIDKFLKLEFVYKPGPPATSQIVLSSKTVISGLMERKNKPAVWEFSGIKVEAKTAAEALAEGSADGAGDYVTACMFTADQKICERGAACAFHENPNGAKGGLVAATATVANTASVYKYTQVLDNAQVLDTAIVKNKARVIQNAQVKDSARIEDISHIYGNAKIYGSAIVKGAARVLDQARVYGDAWVGGDARITNQARVYGNARLAGAARIHNDARVHGDARVSGYAQVKDQAKVSGRARIYEDGRVYGQAQVKGNARVYGNAKVGGNAKLSGAAVVSGTTKVCSGTFTSGTVAHQPSCP